MRGSNSTAATKCLVVGGHGFIGSHVVAVLAHAGHDVTAYGRPARPPLAPRLSGVHYVEGEVRDAHRLRRHAADAAIVIHLAGTSIPQSSVEDPFRDLEVNVGDTLHLLEACREEGVQRLVYVSSGGTVYGVARAVPIKEDHPTEPVCSYGVNKLAAEKYVAMFHHLYGLEYSIVRPSNAYGAVARLKRSPHDAASWVESVTGVQNPEELACLRRRALQVLADDITGDRVRLPRPALGRSCSPSPWAVNRSIQLRTAASSHPQICAIWRTVYPRLDNKIMRMRSLTRPTSRRASRFNFCCSFSSSGRTKIIRYAPV